ncbi:hypothetical protein EQ832_16115 [Pseudomonas sp. ALS1131]|jgi:hypothetical protein|nr:hypothetical protein EQ832_16115 [Pseudomonas sp. ALS1131]
MEFITRHYPGTAPLDLYHTLVSSLHTAHSIGGNVAENTGGVHRLKCGLTVHTLLKIDIFITESKSMAPLQVLTWPLPPTVPEYGGTCPDRPLDRCLSRPSLSMLPRD